MWGGKTLSFIKENFYRKNILSIKLTFIFNLETMVLCGNFNFQRITYGKHFGTVHNFQTLNQHVVQQKEVGSRPSFTRQHNFIFGLLKLISLTVSLSELSHANFPFKSELLESQSPQQEPVAHFLFCMTKSMFAQHRG